MPPKTGKKTAKPQKKEKIFHPQSRKADQLVRANLRKSKLADLARARTRKHGDKGASGVSFSIVRYLQPAFAVNLFGFFYHAIPPEGGVLTLEDMHTIIGDVWLPRFDSELESEKAARRKGRPKSTKEQTLESIKEREAEEYRTGIGALCASIRLTDTQNFY